MLIATVGAFALQDYREGVAVMLFYQVRTVSVVCGESFQKIYFRIDGYCTEFVNVMRGGKLETVDPEEVEVGETIVVKPGEKFHWMVLC